MNNKANNNKVTIDPTVRQHAVRAIILYGCARLALFILLTVLIQILSIAVDATLPIIMSALFALLIAFPLSMFIFKTLRMKATEELAQWNEQRRARKEWIKKELAERE